VSRLGAAVLGAVVLSGCAYHNTLYNAQRLFDEAEGLRRLGRDELAVPRYEDVIRKTADAYRGDPSRDDSGETLYLLGRALLRTGQPREAEGALARATPLAGPDLLPGVLVYRAMALARLGEADSSAGVLAEAFDGGPAGPALAEAYLLRGRLRLAEGPALAGWDDLDLAAGADPAIAVEAGIERLQWGVRHRDLERARTAVGTLLSDRNAAERADTISALVSAVAAVWSASVASTMLGDVGSAAWDGASRGRLQLEQATLFLAAGDTASAEVAAWQVARRRGESAAQARVMLARWRLERTRDLGEAQSVLAILLPGGSDPGVMDMVDAVEELERYSGLGLDQPLGLFAAAEVARDRLDAPVLARGLFLAYADSDPSDPWAPKALLAALDVSRDQEDRSWLRGRLEAHGDSPYVQAARGAPAAGFEALEEELRERLSEIATR
jgi:tetratricopeptide (TPR) repeat protein